ncbi:MAG: MotA/TolQ/ExbB proton channel family protein [Magnetococcus sp. WYHC-3]
MLETLIMGGFLMIPLMACSVIMLAVLIERGLAFQRNAKLDIRTMRAKVLAMLGEGRLPDAMTVCTSTPGPVAAVMLVGLQAYQRLIDAGASSESLRNLMQKAMDDYTPHAIHVCELRLNWLATISNVAPLFGMTGTVTGMIRSFGSLSSAGSLDAGAVGAGISEALVATATGLIIALAALIPFNGFMNRVEKLNLEVGEAASELVEYACLYQEKRTR